MPASARCRDCPRLVPPGTRSGRCARCRARAEAERPTKAERGYDASFRAARRAAAEVVAAGGATCWRCGGAIDPGESWHLGHDDHDRTVIRGPEHPRCNLSAAGRAAHGG